VKTLGKLAKAVVDRWSPQGLDPAAFSWENPLASSGKASQAAKP